jgi:putative ABC transport system substrate-binding protein
MSRTDPFKICQSHLIRQGLRTLGYIEGSNLLIEYRYAENKLDRLPELARELVGLKVDILVISPSPITIRAAQEASRTIPIVVMGATVDPVHMGFVKSLARPGGNITGLTNLDTELHGKRLGLLKEAFPPVSRVAIIWAPLLEEQLMKEVEPTTKALGIQVISVHLEDRLGLPGLESALSTISQERADGLIVPSMRTTLSHRGRVVDFAAKSRLPTIYSREDFVNVGGLMSYSADLMDIPRRVATYIDKILKGSKPAELPIEQPTKFEFVINLRTAKALNLTIPQSVLFRATKVIK